MKRKIIQVTNDQHDFLKKKRANGYTIAGYIRSLLKQVMDEEQLKGGKDGAKQNRI